MEVIAPSSTTDSERLRANAAKVRRGTNVLLVALFLAGLWAPLLGVRIGRHGWDVASRAENRRMAAEPTLFRLKESHSSSKDRIKALAHFPGEFKYYLSDHFGFRSLLIRAHGLLMVKALGVTSNPAVILGKDGWLFLANDGSLEDWRNTDPFTPAQLEQWRQMLEARRDFCAARGIRYLLVTAPSKHDIYPEFMPDVLNRVSTQSRLDQLVNYLRKTHSPVQILDLRGPLLGAKQEGVRLFQKTDTHWNDRGAWIAYESIMGAVRQTLPRASLLSASDFDLVTRERPGMDLAGLLGLNDEFREQSLDLVPRVHLRLPHVQQDRVEPITVEADAPGKPKVVVFRDSFMTSVLPFLAESFGRGVYFWEDGFDRQVVVTEHPDIVIQELAQRKLMLPISMIENATQRVQRVNGRWELARPLK